MPVKDILHKAIEAHKAGLFTQAKKLYQAILQNNPTHGDALHLLGIIYCQQGNYDKAEHSILQAIDYQPSIGEFQLSLGNTYLEQGKIDLALFRYQQALYYKPLYPEAHLGIGNTLLKNGFIIEAIESYQKAIKQAPNLVIAYNNLGNAYRKLNRLTTAKENYEKALSLDASIPEVYKNLGLLYIQQGDTIQAKNNLIKATELNASVEHLSQLYSLQMSLADWEAAMATHSKLEAAQKTECLLNMPVGETPFQNCLRKQNLEENLNHALKWSYQFITQAPKKNPPFVHRARQSKRINIGYLSCDFIDHATAYLIAGLLENHDPNRYNITLFSYGLNDNSTIRERIKQNGCHFFDIEPYSYESSAKTIYDNNIDILVDLKIYTLGARPEICTQRPAPIQINYLGYPGTSGNPNYDYIISDSIITPKSDYKYYSEACVILPNSYQVNDNRQIISSKPCNRSMHALPEKAIVFCSFNQILKIDPVVFSSWMRIMQQVPNSILWLQDCPLEAQNNLTEKAKQHHISKERLIFAKQLSKEEHLKRLTLADIALDTLTCNGHTTTSDALFTGVPVIALYGSHFASRVSASLLTAMEVPELITDSLSNYEALAIRLALNPTALAKYKRLLQVNKKIAPLFNTGQYTRHLETAYDKIWTRYCSGLQPNSMEILDYQELLV